MSSRTVRGRDVARDVHGGMDDNSLMEKYNLTPKQLERVLRQLVDADLIDLVQVYKCTTLSDSMVAEAFGDGHRFKEQVG